MRDVAALAGVSTKTVSRAINGDRYVSVDVQERVEQAVAALGYVPNMLAQTFRTGHDRAIGLAVPDIADPFFGAVIQAVEELARQRRTAVLVTSLGTDPAAERRAVEPLLSRQISGLMIAPISTDHAYLTLWQARTGVVFIDRPPAGVSADSVVEDDTGGARAAVQHLLDRGHHRIAFLGNSRAVVTTERRLAGYRAALVGAGLPVDPALVQVYEQTHEASVAAVRAVLAQADPPTAVFASNSRISISVIPVVQAAAHPLAFISFGDFPMAEALRPSVSVIDQDPAALGHTAVRRLFDRVDDPDATYEQHQVLPVRLRVRESSEVCGPWSVSRAG